MGDEIISLLAAWSAAASETIGEREAGLAALAAVFATTLFVALRQFRFLSNIRDHEKFVEQIIRQLGARRGRKPIDPNKVGKRELNIRAAKETAWRILWRHFWLLAVTGLFFPCALLFAIAMNYDILHPGAAAFADPASGVLMNALAPADAAILVFDQFMRGALLDFMEVYRLEFAPVTHNSAELVFSGLLIFFRALTGLFTGALVFFLFQFLKTRFSKTFKTLLHTKMQKEIAA
ncbi:hypothetical protein ACSHT0_13780 [Tepidicaulis sp. LMO-SS28]|uniref:hypothetical protein n=1 Tax=Tepidicaulis sp. LMO-SS28 TaxID=3447455 RepID=UPI003EDEE3EF